MADPEDEVEEVPRGSAGGDLRVARTAADLGHFNTIMLDDAEVKKVVLVTGVTLKSASVTTDHNLIRNNDKDWEFHGTLYPDPDWKDGDTSANPVSHTEKIAVGIEATFEVTPADATEATCSITAEASAGDLTFSSYGTLKGGKVKFAVVCSPLSLVSGTVGKLTTDLSWKVKDIGRDKEFEPGSSLGHTLYMTFGKPASPYTNEDGSTLKRMKKAVDVIAGTAETDPHKIAEKLQKLFNHYTLTPDGAIPKEYKHPGYLNDKGGAWWLADYLKYAGECQAMVRYMLALMKQVGCPGTIEPVVVWAEEDDKGNVTVKEGVLGVAAALVGAKTRSMGGLECKPTLVDKNPVVGHTYTGDPSSGNYIGINNFEACARVDHGGAKKYYPGGLQGPRNSPQEVIKCFYALCWVHVDEGDVDLGTFDKITVMQIVKRWMDASGNALP